MQYESAKNTGPKRAEEKIDRSKGIDFLRGFLRNPGQVGSVIPSSRFMERKIIELSELGQARTVVELGPGTGGTTRAILAAMPQRANLLTVDLDPVFTEIIRSVGDPRLIAHTGSAADLEFILKSYGLNAPDAVISGIPFSTIPESVGYAIIESVQNSLAANGIFLAYQFRSAVVRRVQPVMGYPDQSAFEWLNIPPMRLYQWRKKTAS